MILNFIKLLIRILKISTFYVVVVMYNYIQLIQKKKHEFYVKIVFFFERSPSILLLTRLTLRHQLTQDKVSNCFFNLNMGLNED